MHQLPVKESIVCGPLAKLSHYVFRAFKSKYASRADTDKKTSESVSQVSQIWLCY